MTATPQKMNDYVSSLKQRLREVRSSKIQSIEKVDLLNELAWEISLSERPRAIALTRQAKELAQELNYERGYAYSLRNVAYCHLMSSNLEEALQLSKQALQSFQRLNDQTGRASAIDTLALTYWRLGNYDRALELSLDGLNLNKRIKNKRGEAWAYHNLAAIHFEVGDHKEAIENYHRASRIFQEIDYGMGECRIAIGLGEVCYAMKDLEKALAHYTRALQLNQMYKIQIGISNSLTSIGNIYREMGKPDRAEKFYRQSLELFQKGDYKESKAIALMNFGKLESNRGRHERAFELLNEALKIIKKTKAKPSAFRIQKTLSELYEAAGDFKNALKHHKAFHKLREAVFSEEANIKFKNLQIQTTIDKVEKEAEMRQLQVVNSEKMALVNNLVSGLAHEINTPIGVINSNTEVLEIALRKLAAQINNGKNQPNKTLEILKNTHQTTAAAGQKIAELITNLKNFARLDQSAVQYADIHEIIEDTLALLSWKLSERIELHKKFGNLPKIKCRPQDLNQVFMTLFINAADAIRQRGEIRIKTANEDERIKISISDTGRGIPKSRLARIFEVGFSAKDARIRMNLGLANCYKIIQTHGGEIQVSSEVGKGTEFLIFLPVEPDLPPLPAIHQNSLK